MIGANIELWAYRLYANGALYLEEVFQRSDAISEAATQATGKNPVMVAAGKKAAITRASSTWTFDRHVDGKPERIRSISFAVREFMLGLDPTMEEAPKKLYVAYRTSQNIVCMEVQKQGCALPQIGSQDYFRSSWHLSRRLACRSLQDWRLRDKRDIHARSRGSRTVSPAGV